VPGRGQLRQGRTVSAETVSYTRHLFKHIDHCRQGPAHTPKLKQVTWRCVKPRSFCKETEKRETAPYGRLISISGSLRRHVRGPDFSPSISNKRRGCGRGDFVFLFFRLSFFVFRFSDLILPSFLVFGPLSVLPFGSLLFWLSRMSSRIACIEPGRSRRRNFVDSMRERGFQN